MIPFRERRRALTPRLLDVAGIVTLICLLVGPVTVSASQPFPESATAETAEKEPSLEESLQREVMKGVGRLPLAAVLGTVLALRPRRRGTPVRQPAVVQTQIILAVVGALIMLVVGSSLARAFGIVGAANLIRYRSKIEDPKDAVVMLCALAVGLAAGVGLYGLAIFATFFLTGSLWIIEGFEPKTRVFQLSVKLGDKTAELRPRVEAILRRHKAEYELRSQSEEEVCYFVTAPFDLQTDRVSGALTSLVDKGQAAIEWDEKSKSKVGK
jgi:uncharacterized membrane protein YhiD involved in acid resistance